MRALQSDVLRYDCQFFAITRRAPQAARATRLFLDCLATAHDAPGDQTLVGA